MRRLSRPRLSTPSLGITLKNAEENAIRLCVSPFNSLSRDHQGERAEISVVDAEAEAGYIAVELAKYAVIPREGVESGLGGDVFATPATDSRLVIPREGVERTASRHAHINAFTAVIPREGVESTQGTLCRADTHSNP